MVPLSWPSMLFHLIISIVLLLNGFNATDEVGAGNKEVDSQPLTEQEKIQNQIRQMIIDGERENEAQKIMNENALRLLDKNFVQISEDIVENIRKKMHWNYEDENAIKEVAKIFEKMPEELNKKWKDLFADTLKAKILFNRLMTIYNTYEHNAMEDTNKNVLVESKEKVLADSAKKSDSKMKIFNVAMKKIYLVNGVLAIFEILNKDKNFVKNLEGAISIVRNSIEFYKNMETILVDMDVLFENYKLMCQMYKLYKWLFKLNEIPNMDSMYENGEFGEKIIKILVELGKKEKEKEKELAIVQNIRKKYSKINKTEEKITTWDVSDDFSIWKVLKYFDRMPVEWRKFRVVESLFEDALIERIAYNRFMAIYDKTVIEQHMIERHLIIFNKNKYMKEKKTLTDSEKKVLVNKIFEIFEMKNEMKTNFKEKIVGTISMVEKAKKFYEFKKNPNAKNDELGEWKYPNMDSKLNGERKRINKFYEWLKKVQNDIVKFNVNEYKMGEEILESLIKYVFDREFEINNKVEIREIRTVEGEASDNSQNEHPLMQFVKKGLKYVW